MAESGPDYTLRRPVDVNTPLPVIFHEDEEDIGGYFVQEDGIATKHRPQPTKASKHSNDVPVPIVSVIEDGEEGSKFLRPTHWMSSNQLDTDVRMAVEYDAVTDDEDFIHGINLYSPAKKGSQPLTPELLECYIDFFEKNYFFTGGRTRLPVRDILLKKRAQAKCLICSFSDPDQPVLECHCCGIIVHSSCYHDLLYSQSLIKTEVAQKLLPTKQASSKSSQTKSGSHGRKPRTSDAANSSEQAKSSSTHTASTPGRLKRGQTHPVAPDGYVALTTRRSSAKQASIQQEEEETGDVEVVAMEVDEPSTSPSESAVYKPPFVDQVRDDGTWWCAKCASEDPFMAPCELCGCTTGTVFPKYILAADGKPRILNRRLPFGGFHMKAKKPNLSVDTSGHDGTDTEEEGDEMPIPPQLQGLPEALYTPVRRADLFPRRRGRKPRQKPPQRDPDILWFHEICACAKPRLYQHLIDPDNITYESELHIPESDNESDESLATTTDKKPVPSPNAKTPQSSPTKGNAASKKKTAPHGHSHAKHRSGAHHDGDRARTCRLCGSRAGACVMCSVAGCNRHFHPHCAEKFGLIVERDDPLVFKCRIHSFPKPKDDLSHTDLFADLELLQPNELAALEAELAWHDNVVSQGKPFDFWSRVDPEQKTASGASGRSGGSGSAGTSKANGYGTKSGKAVGSSKYAPTPSYSAPRPALLSVDANMRQYVFNFWMEKRVAVSHELIHRLRILKQDENRRLEVQEAVSAMEASLSKLVRLRQHMERIRILVDLCKKREALKKLQADEMAALVSLPGLLEHVQEVALAQDGPTTIEPPAKARKLSVHSTPHSQASQHQPRRPSLGPGRGAPRRPSPTLGHSPLKAATPASPAPSHTPPRSHPKTPSTRPPAASPAKAAPRNNTPKARSVPPRPALPASSLTASLPTPSRPNPRPTPLQHITFVPNATPTTASASRMDVDDPERGQVDIERISPRGPISSPTKRSVATPTQNHTEPSPSAMPHSGSHAAFRASSPPTSPTRAARRATNSVADTNSICVIS